MTDVVERLRVLVLPPGLRDEADEVMSDAADEIERLRGALNKILSQATGAAVGDGEAVLLKDMEKIIGWGRDALHL